MDNDNDDIYNEDSEDLDNDTDDYYLMTMSMKIVKTCTIKKGTKTNLTEKLFILGMVHG